MVELFIIALGYVAACMLVPRKWKAGIGFGGGGGSVPTQQTVTQQTQVPAFLRPFVREQAEIGTGALRDLQGQLGGAGADELVAGFDPLQTAAQQLAASGAFSFDPQSFIQPAQQGLTETARGDFLFGGQGFDQAVDAAVRAAQPHVFSTFGGAGRGTGGLAQAAIAEAATDAFARQFGQERSRQFAAQSALPGLGREALGLATAPADVLNQIGAARQAMAQRRLLAPITAQESLLAAAGGGVPLQSLLGQTQTSRGETPFFTNTGGQVLGGLLGLGGLLSGGGLFSEGGLFG